MLSENVLANVLHLLLVRFWKTFHDDVYAFVIGMFCKDVLRQHSYMLICCLLFLLGEHSSKMFPEPCQNIRQTFYEQKFVSCEKFFCIK
jgi:hypothetical protein